jgi:RNA polymerase sigma-70 factor, ECF subfamily
MQPSRPDDVEAFESNRPALLALAYRMLGDLSRAEDAVQEAWLRWQKRHVDVQTPKAFLVTTVTRLCLDELGSARARHEESRSDRLPEPIDLAASGIGQVETNDEVSMAFLVLLQRLTPAERAVLLLHDVFDMGHAEIGTVLGKSEAACRQLLSRARQSVAAERRVFETSPEDHRRLLMAFVEASTGGDQERLLEVLAEDTVLVADGGPTGGHFGRLRNISRPVAGREQIAALMKAFAREQSSVRATLQERVLNGQPAFVAFRDGRAVAAVLISAAEGKIRRVFVQIDPERLRHVGPFS